MTNAETLGAVERERERESHILQNMEFANLEGKLYRENYTRWYSI